MLFYFGEADVFFFTCSGTISPSSSTVQEKMHLLVKLQGRQVGQSHSSTATINLVYAFKRHDVVTDIS